MGFPEIVKGLAALDPLLKTCLEGFGPWGTAAIIVSIPLSFFGFKWYQLRQRDKDVSLALQEKERTIQRLADENREQRVLIYKEIHGWSDDQIRTYIVRGEFLDGVESRKALEDGLWPPKPASPEKSKRRKK